MSVCLMLRFAAMHSLVSRVFWCPFRLMCALAALAERKEEVYDLFVTDDGSNEVQHANAAGVYKVRYVRACVRVRALVQAAQCTVFTQVGRTNESPHSICKNGEWQFVRLDDYFPCAPEAGPIYSKSHGNELWVLLVEKAMAKLCGGYDRLKGGWAYEALMVRIGSNVSRQA